MVETFNQTEHLLQLAAATLVGVIAVAALLRLTQRAAPADATIVGYPPDHFPNRAVAGQPALQALTAAQRRLLALRHQIAASPPTPITSDLAISLGAFLIELRKVMDAAYQVALVGAVYDQSGHLARLTREVERLEAQVAAEITRHLLAHAHATQGISLDRHLATLRLCAEELTHLEERG